MVTRGGLFDDHKYADPFYQKKTRINHLLDEYSYRHSSRSWRSGYSIKEAIKLCKKNNIPLWFLKKHIKYISQECVWQKQEKYYENITIDTNDYEYINYYYQRSFCSNGRFHVVKESDLPYNMIKYKKKFIEVDGEEYSKNVPYNISVINLVTTNDMLIYAESIRALWDMYSTRFISIYGLDCKMCGKHKKNKKSEIICDDFKKYQTQICFKCLKKFCKLTEKQKEIYIKRIKND